MKKKKSLQAVAFALFAPFAFHAFAYRLQGFEDEVQAHVPLPDVGYHWIPARAGFPFLTVVSGFAPDAVGGFAALLAVAVGALLPVSCVEGVGRQLFAAAQAFSDRLQRGMTDTGVCPAGHWCLSRRALVSVGLDTGVDGDRRQC